jgi:hypothetical protein
MNDVIGAKPPMWFRIVAVLAVLWNLVGVFFYLVNVGVVAVPGPEMSDAERAMMESMPNWTTAAFAVGVFAGLLGSVGLLVAKSWARLLLWLSLLALILLEGWWMFLSGAADTIGPSAYVMPALVVIIAILLAWLANTGVKRGWLT